MASPTPNPSRRVGRPSTLSRELIVAEALALLDEVGLHKFSVHKLGKRLNVSAMSFYNYFGSVDALLEAVADHVFTLFELPPPAERWQDFLLAWLEALSLHIERYPVALQVISWNENLSAGWLRAWVPVVEIIAAHEAEPIRRKAIAHWFSLSAMGVMAARRSRPIQMQRLPDALMKSLSQPQRDLLAQLYGGSPPSDEQAVLGFAFINIIRGLEGLFAGEGILPRATR